MSDKPPFDPSQPFEEVKPTFDPTQPYSVGDQSTAPTQEEMSSPSFPLKDIPLLPTVDQLPQPSKGMYSQYDKFLKQAEESGLDPSKNPSAFAIAGMLNNIAQGLQNPEALASAVQDVTTFGQGQKISAPVNAYLMKKYFGGGEDALEQENQRQDTVRADNPYLPFIAGPIAGEAQSLVKTEGVIPSYLKPNTEKLRNKLTNFADEKYIKALGGNKKEMEEAIKLGDRDLEGIGRRARDEGIISPFAGTETMRERALDVKNAGWDKMASTFDEADAAGAAFSPEEAAQAFKNKEGGFYRSPINRDISQQFDNTLESIAMRGKEAIPLGGESGAQALKQEIDRVGFPKGKSPVNPSGKQEIAQDASSVIADKITEAAQSLLGPESVQTLEKGRSQYGTGAQSSKLLRSKLASEQAREGFKFSDLYNKPIQSVLSPQFRGVGADKIAEVLQKTPEFFGKFAPALQAAAQRGQAAISAASHVLSQRHEEYRAKQRELNNQEQPNEGN